MSQQAVSQSVLVIDDHPLFRKGVQQLMGMGAQFRLVGEAADGNEGLKLATGEGEPVDWGVILLGVAVAAATGYLCIAWLLRVINRVGLAPFAIYRLALAALLFSLFA